MTHPRNLLAAVVFLMLASIDARAHSLGAECNVHGDHVTLEAFFSDDTPARNAKVIVRAESKAIVVEGSTDNEGVWTFPVPPDGKYEIVIDAGGGHLTTVMLTLPFSAPDGRSRREFTSIPWLRIGLGLAVIAIIGGGLSWWLRRSGPAAPERDVQPK